MVSELGLLDGLTATGIILSATIFGLLSLYKSIKLKAKLLTIAALTMFFVGLLWFGPGGLWPRHRGGTHPYQKGVTSSPGAAVSRLKSGQKEYPPYQCWKL